MLIGPHSKNKVNKFNSGYQPISLDMKLEQYSWKAEPAVVLHLGTILCGYLSCMGAYYGDFIQKGGKPGESPKAPQATVAK